MDSIDQFRNLPYLAVRNGKVVEASRLFCALTQYEPEELLKKPVELVLKQYLHINADLNVAEEKITTYVFTKSHEPYEVGISVCQDTETNVRLFAFVQKSHSEILSRLPYLSQLYNSDHYGIAIYDSNSFTLLKANAEYVKMLRMPPDCIGKRINDIYPDFAGSESEMRWNCIVQTGESVYLQEFKGNIGGMKGRYWENTITPVILDGKVAYVVSMLTDLTEKVLKRTEEELLQANNRLTVALESVGAGIWETDLATGNQVWSPEVYELYGLDPNELVPLSKGISRIAPEDRAGFEHSWNEAVKSPCEFWRDEFRIIHPVKGIVWLKGTGKFIYDDKGNPVKMIGINIDITDQKKQQEEIIRSEKEKNEALENVIKMKDEFLYLITHEFKTPLTVIKAAIQAMDMLCGKNMPEKADKFLNSIKQNTNRQLRLVNNLLDVTRINAGEIRLKEGVFNIEYLIRSIVDSIQPYAQHKKVKLNFTARFGANEILIDEEKIERIILNLVSNALKFTPEGKSIDIVLCRKRYKNRNMVCIAVTDQGIGIPKSKQDKIFERFGQADTSLSRQAEGTGIGLYLVKLFVNAMNGDITLRSKEGKGSTFTVILPFIEATPLERITAGSGQDEQVMRRDSRLIQAVAVEFSDIYF